WATVFVETFAVACTTAHRDQRGIQRPSLISHRVASVLSATPGKCRRFGDRFSAARRTLRDAVGTHVARTHAIAAAIARGGLAKNFQRSMDRQGNMSTTNRCPRTWSFAALCTALCVVGLAGCGGGGGGGG